MSPGAGPEHRRPRWVTVTLGVTVLLVVLLAVLWALGGGHGPGRHLSPPASRSEPALQVSGHW